MQSLCNDSACYSDEFHLNQGVNHALNDLIRGVFAQGATDLYLMEGESPRVRLDGVLAHTDLPVVEREELAEIWRACAVDPLIVHDCDASYELAGIGRLRVNLFHSLGRLAVAARPIRSEIPDFASLNLPSDLLSGWMQRRAGLVLVTGPTGSGKSTTLASCLEWVNLTQSRHVVTIEDPIEYLFQNQQSFFSQREVRRDTEDFAVALRAALRQSPDVIMVGEIRDPETAAIALRAAETGHLVISTLHSSGVVDTLERLSHILESHKTSIATSEMLSHQLIGVISQQLLPCLHGGLIPAFEYLQNEGATRPWIAEQKHGEIADHVSRAADPSSTMSFLHSLVFAVKQGLVDQEVARSAANRPQDFDRAMRGIA